MKRSRSYMIAFVALAASSILHAASLTRISYSADQALAGGTAQSVPLLGDSFADMAAGGAVAVAADSRDLTQPLAPSKTSAVRVDSQTPAPAVTAPISPTTLDHVVPVAIPSAQAAPIEPAVAAGPDADDAANVPSLQVDALAATSPAPTQTPMIAAMRTAPPRRDVQPTKAGDAPSPVAAPKPKAPTKAAKAHSAGNAPVDARKGATDGAETGQARTTKGTARAEGDGGTSRAATYGTVVMKRIRATRKSRAPARGTTVIGFAVADSGGLKTLRVLKSSGSDALDAVALDHIRRAAPFPKPPKGASRQFSFEFVGRK
ncbi:MAG: TonB family protein [Gemmobacter sp.]|nr:TonB family protein [Gemmobacter sp.]